MPVLTLGPSTAEVSESAGTQVLVVSQSVASSETVTVDYSTSDGTAASGSDYTAASGTLTFAPGASLTQVLQVPILADALNEDDETFMVELGAAEHATVSPPSSSSAVTITDDDALPEVSLPSGFVFADEDDGGLDVEVSLSAASGREVRVNYATADSNASSYRATAGEDYVAVGGTLTFAAGERAKAFRVSITDDTVDEELFEEFDLRLSDPLNAALGRSTQQSRIYDNDEKPVVSLSPAPSTSVDEGGGVTFTMGLSSVSARPVNVTYETSDGTAAAPDDYSGASGRVNVLIPAGEMSRTFLVSTTEDALDEAAETFMVRIRPNIQLDDHSTLGGADRATVTIDDNDDPPVLRVAGVEAREDAGPLVFTVTMPASGKTVTVGYAVSAGTATPDGGAEREVERGGGGVGDGGAGFSGGGERHRPERYRVDHRGGVDGEHRDGDVEGGGQRCRFTGQDGDGRRIGDGGQRGGLGAAVAGVDDPGRRGADGRGDGAVDGGGGGRGDVPGDGDGWHEHGAGGDHLPGGGDGDVGGRLRAAGRHAEACGGGRQRRDHHPDAGRDGAGPRRDAGGDPDRGEHVDGRVERVAVVGGDDDRRPGCGQRLGDGGECGDRGFGGQFPGAAVGCGGQRRGRGLVDVGRDGDGGCGLHGCFADDADLPRRLDRFAHLVGDDAGRHAGGERREFHGDPFAKVSNPGAGAVRRRAARACSDAGLPGDRRRGGADARPRRILRRDRQALPR